MKNFNKQKKTILTATMSMVITLAMFVTFCVPVFAAGSSSSSSSSSGTTPLPPTSPTPPPEYVPPEDPKLFIESVSNDILKAGDTVMLPMSLKVSDQLGYADNIRMRFSPETGKDVTGSSINYFTFFTSNGWFNASKIVSEKTPISPYIQINPSTPDGTYSAKIDLEYTREATSFKSSDTIMITVHGRSTNVLKVQSAKFALSEIGVANKSKMYVEIANPSGLDYEEVSLSLDTVNSKGFSLYENFSPVLVGTIAANDKATATFSVYIDTSIANGNYPISFDLTYKDGGGSIIASKEVVPIQVKRSADSTGKGNVPRIIIESYKTNVEQIQAGQEFKLDFTLKNANAKTAVSNIKVVLSATTTSGSGAGATSSEVFFPASGSNSFYIPTIAPGATVSNSITLMSKQDVEPGVYAVQLKLDYEDASGNPIPTATEQIAFPVVQEQRLEIQSMNIPTVGSQGSTIPINFQYINKGKATIYNLSVTVEGDFTMEGGSTYVGNLTAGYNDYFDSAVTPTKEGALKGTIVLNYEDASGTQKDKRTDFTVNVSAGGASGDMMGGMVDGTIGGGTIDTSGMINPDTMPKKGISPILIVVIVVVVLLIGGLVTVIIIKKKKAKKVKVQDEED